jgi:CubicO group peptidase (beta-lactamase class C family)
MLRRHLLQGLIMALRRDRIDQAYALITKFTESEEVTAASLLVRQGSSAIIRGFGEAKQTTVYLLASITKPMTVSAIMLLRDRGQLALEDPVRKFLPEFTGGDRDIVTIRHLLTHTSGLPDMLPENEDLRKRHAPLEEFTALTCKTPLLFQPGTEVRYQSMGILLASAVAERITGTRFRVFLQKEIFLPLGMNQTSLGLGGRRVEELVQCQVPKTGWDWNSAYWRDLGAPWGGAHGNVMDVGRFLEAFRSPESRVWKTGTTTEMVTNQTAPLEEPWGFGWMLKPGTFGRRCSTSTYGHYGSTGTVAWRDPASNTTCVLLTTRPASDSRQGLLGPVSDLVSDAAAA